MTVRDSPNCSGQFLPVTRQLDGRKSFVPTVTFTINPNTIMMVKIKFAQPFVVYTVTYLRGKTT